MYLLILNFCLLKDWLYKNLLRIFGKPFSELDERIFSSKRALPISTKLLNRLGAKTLIQNDHYYFITWPSFILNCNLSILNRFQINLLHVRKILVFQNYFRNFLNFNSFTHWDRKNTTNKINFDMKFSWNVLINYFVLLQFFHNLLDSCIVISMLTVLGQI